MPRKPRQMYFLVNRQALDDLAQRQGLYTVLDMLRYDGCHIHSDANTPGYYLFSNEMGPTLERWRSFGIGIQYFHVGSEEGRLMDFARQEAADAGDLRWASFRSKTPA